MNSNCDSSVGGAAVSIFVGSGLVVTGSGADYPADENANADCESRRESRAQCYKRHIGMCNDSFPIKLINACCQYSIGCDHAMRKCQCADDERQSGRQEKCCRQKVTASTKQKCDREAQRRKAAESQPNSVRAHRAIVDQPNGFFNGWGPGEHRRLSETIPKRPSSKSNCYRSGGTRIRGIELR